ncbi:MAG: hypothetical protein AABY22_17040, partial [Nanoarchaeota archaeon]
KQIIYFNELETFVTPISSPARTKSDEAINTYLAKVGGTIRHRKGELWADIKSPSVDIDDRLRRRFTNWYVTRIDDYSDISLLGEKEFGTRDFKTYNRSLRTKTKIFYGFLIRGEEMPVWYNKNYYEKYGFRITDPRVCTDKKVVMYDFETINGIPIYEIVGGKSEDLVSIVPLKKELLRLIKRGEPELINFMKSGIEIQESTKETREDRFKKFIDMVTALNKKDMLKKYYDYPRYELERIFKLSRTTIWQYEKMAKEKNIDLNNVIVEIIA